MLHSYNKYIFPWKNNKTIYWNFLKVIIFDEVHFIKKIFSFVCSTRYSGFSRNIYFWEKYFKGEINECSIKKGSSKGCGFSQLLNYWSWKYRSCTVVRELEINARLISYISNISCLPLIEGKRSTSPINSVTCNNNDNMTYNK